MSLFLYRRAFQRVKHPGDLRPHRLFGNLLRKPFGRSKKKTYFHQNEDKRFLLTFQGNCNGNDIDRVLTLSRADHLYGCFCKGAIKCTMQHHSK